MKRRPINRSLWDQIYVISASGGEAFAVSEGDESVHAFEWAADSRAIYFVTRQPQTKEEKAAQKKEPSRFTSANWSAK